MGGDLSAALSELDELVGHLEGIRARAANAFAAETHFFARVAHLVERRERERATRAGDGSRTHGTQLGMREVYAEIAAALRLSEYQVAARVSSASVMRDHFHETLCDVSDGRLSPQHAQVIADAGIQIDDPIIRAEYERHARDIASELTAAQLRDALDGLVSRLDPDGTRERVRQAVAERGVRLRHVKAGLARVSIDLPTAEAVGALNRLSDMADEILAENRATAHELGESGGPATEAARARASSAPTVTSTATECPTTADEPANTVDERTKRQIEADIAADLLLTSAPEAHGVHEQTRITLAAIRPTVHLTIPSGVLASGVLASGVAASPAPAFPPLDASELAGGTFGGPTVVAVTAADPAGTRTAVDPAVVTSRRILGAIASAERGVAEVPGHGPVDDATARQLAALADGWVRVFTDPETGVPVEVDRYRPTARQRLYLEARDRHCRFPGCRRPAARCDLDHTTAHAEGGPTALCNLACLCERHHTVKHHTDWGAIQLPGGVMKWISPTRRIHRTRPPGAVRFVASPQSPGAAPQPAPF